MTQIAASYQTTPLAPRAAVCPAPQMSKPKTVEPAKQESATDRVLRMSNYGVAGAGTVAGMVAIPHQIVKSAPAVTRFATGIGLSATMNSLTQGGLISRAAGTLAKGSLFVAKHTENVAQVAGTLMKAPTIGRIFSPPVADVMTRKVLPTANAIGAGIAILDNSNRLYKANQAKNTAGQVVAGSQIALNLTSAVTGYLPGKFQLISAAAGLGGLALEIAHQAGGLGK